MRFTLSVAMCPADELVPLAKAAEASGWDAVAVPDSLFWSEQVSSKYPYTQTGKRMWTPDTPFVETFVALSAIAAVTERVRLMSHVLKLGPRSPLLVAKSASSLAALAGGRLVLGVGLGWLREENEWCGQPFSDRGKRGDEAIALLREHLQEAPQGDKMREHAGEFYAHGKLRLSPPAPSPVPLVYGGHSAPGLRRAAALCDGWTSAMMTEAKLRETITELRRLREAAGRADEPFEIHAVATDVWNAEGFRRLEEAGVTDLIVVPWMLLGKGLFIPVEDKIGAVEQFGSEVVATFRG